ncbi:MAG: tRNA (guanosine(37)-N1)-methyltransferase TrmD [Bryobacterales bacterium]|nr:tRNA (guanosine(37)-N1)-methyltransferase TrmD [Bryobacterales bacterium]
MIFHVLTIFPGFFRGPFEHGVVAKAIQAGILDLQVHDLRNWAKDRHKTVDDRPFGGGEGMLLKAEPIFEAVESILAGGVPGGARSGHVVLLSAQGRLFSQETARRFAMFDELLLICGRYEGVDERVAQYLADDEISIGDYVLSGGELPAAVVVDAVARLLPGVLGNEASTVQESFSAGKGILDCPQYTRPAEYRGWRVPDVLLGGHHAEIRKWRRQAALEKTARLRSDLLKSFEKECDDE